MNATTSIEAATIPPVTAYERDERHEPDQVLREKTFPKAMNAQTEAAEYLNEAFCPGRAAGQGDPHPDQGCELSERGRCRVARP